MRVKGTNADWVTLIGCCCRREDDGGGVKRGRFGEGVSRLGSFCDRTLSTIESYGLISSSLDSWGGSVR